MGSTTFPEPNEPPLREVSHELAVTFPELVLESAGTLLPEPKLPPFRLGLVDGATGEPASVQAANTLLITQAMESARRRCIGIL
jgi:hypothetical protein